MASHGFNEMVEQYKLEVLQGFQDHRNGLEHPHPGVVMQSALRVETILCDAGDRITFLQHRGYNNPAFYKTIGLVSQLLHDAAMSVDCGGLSSAFISGLETAIKCIKVDITQGEFETTARELLRYR